MGRPYGVAFNNYVRIFEGNPGEEPDPHITLYSAAINWWDNWVNPNIDWQIPTQNRLSYLNQGIDLEVTFGRKRGRKRGQVQFTGLPQNVDCILTSSIVVRKRLAKWSKRFR